MERLRLELLGGFSARLPGGGLCLLPRKKAQALLAYLALPTGRYHSREKLTALFWGDTPETQARQSFRQALAMLRRALGEPPLVLVQGDALALDSRVVTVDVAELEIALAEGSPDALERAAALYRGDLLDGFSLDEAPFEEWRALERERLHELVLEGLARLLRQQIRAERGELAIQTARRILALDPLQEAVHRALMRLLLRQGRRAAALQQYQVCVSALQRELGVEPEEETRELYRELLRRTGTDHRRLAEGPAAAHPVEAELVGRAAEIGALRDALERALDQGARMALVTGEAGIGKTRLIEEFRVEAVTRGMRVLTARCHETEQPLPFRPWVDALRGDGPALDPGLVSRLTSAARVSLARLFPELASPNAPAVTASDEHGLLFEAIAELVGHVALDDPVVILLEDLHWADAMSIRLLAFLGRRIHRLPVFVVGTMRPEELVDAPVLGRALQELRGEARLDEIVLGPLSEVETGALGQALQPSIRTRRDRGRIMGEIWARSEGNPFVIVESLRALGAESVEAWMGQSRLTRRVQDFVAARLDRLGERPGQVVAVASVIGRDFPFTLLPPAAGMNEREAAEAVEELVRRRIFDTVGDHLDFCHDWIRHVAYDRLVPARRAVLHSAIGGALEELHRDRLDDVTDQLGHHYSRAGDARRAIPHLVRFADLAAMRHAFDDAYQAFQQALAAVEQLSPAERDRCRLDVVLRQAFLLSILGRQREVLELLQTHVGHLTRVADPGMASEYYFRLGLTQFYLGDHAQSQLAARQALEEGERAGDPVAIGKALHPLSLSAYHAGNTREGIAAATRGISLLDRPHTQHWLGLVYHDLALNCLVAGALDAALDAEKHADAIGQAAQQPRLRALAGSVTTWGLALRGDDELAIETAHRSLELARDPMSASLISGALGHAYLERGDARSAITLLSRVVDQLSSTPVRHAQVRSMVLLAEAHLLAGDIVRAREAANRALEQSRAAGMAFVTGLAQRTRGRIALAASESREAEDHLTGALATLTQCGAAFEVARTRMDLAAIRAKRGDHDAAREDLMAALAAFEAANTPKRAAEARELARALGLALPGRPVELQ